MYRPTNSTASEGVVNLSTAVERLTCVSLPGRHTLNAWEIYGLSVNIIYAILVGHSFKVCVATFPFSWNSNNRCIVSYFHS